MLEDMSDGRQQTGGRVLGTAHAVSLLSPSLRQDTALIGNGLAMVSANRQVCRGRPSGQGQQNGRAFVRFSHLLCTSTGLQAMSCRLALCAALVVALFSPSSVAKGSSPSRTACCIAY